MEISSNNKTLHEILSQFNQMEEELKLFSLEISGIKIWQYLRFRIFQKILVRKNIQSPSHDIVRNKHIKSFIKNIQFIFKNQSAFFQKKKEKEVLVFNNSRRRYINGEYWAIYTDFLFDNINCNYQAIEIPSMSIPIKTPKIKNTIYVDYAIIIIKTILESIKRCKIPKIKSKDLTFLEKTINNKFNVKINLINEIKRILKLRMVFQWYFNKILKKFNPKLVIEVVSYSLENMVLNEICRNMNIITIELQHGVVYRHHLAYNYPENVNLDVFPDYFFSFGKYWKSLISLPIPEEKIIEVGFPFFEQQYLEYKENQQIQEKERILFISQGSIGEKLSIFASNLAKLTDLEIIYKLHPGEYKRWKKEYKYLHQAKNVVVIDHNDISLYQLFAESTTIVGVYSTAIYESLPFNLKTFIVKLPGYESIEPLVKQGFAILISKPEELLIKMNTTDSISKKKNIDYFFKKNAVENQKKALLNLLNLG